MAFGISQALEQWQPLMGAVAWLSNAVDGDKQHLEASERRFLAPVLGSSLWGWHWEHVTPDKELSWAPALLCSG